MKKQVLTIALGLLVATAVFVPLFIFVRMTIQDHKAIQQVVAFINNSLAQQQAAATPAK